MWERRECGLGRGKVSNWEKAGRWNRSICLKVKGGQISSKLRSFMDIVK